MVAAFFQICVLLTVTVIKNWVQAANQFEEKWEEQYRKEIGSLIMNKLEMTESLIKKNFSKSFSKSFIDRLTEEQEEKTQIIITAEQEWKSSGEINIHSKYNTIEADSVITSAIFSIYIKSFTIETDFIIIILKENNNIISSRPILKNSFGWIDFDVTLAFQKWTRSSNSSLRSLFLSCNTCGNRLQISTEKQHTPYLHVSFFTKKGLPRERRKTWTCNESVSCCSRPVYISFEDINWRWVLSPKGFWTNKCMGKCDKENPDKSTCCAPLTLGSITMYYHNGDYLVYGKKLENIVIKDCGCQ
ncbi:inhibin beta B chain-like [Hydra vulgaris]|uniref:Inhibin beta B chain-like n=1 Tax=Hydra vulgaris TaxID=6087 RepID=A0ABM4BWN8_HYDVU